MFYLIRSRPDGQCELYDRRTGAVLFTGTAEEARKRLDAINAWTWL